MRRKNLARLVGSDREIELRPGVIAISAEVPDVPASECFLCTAPDPQNHKDGCDAYLGGFVDGVASMVRGKRPPLCKKHEVQLREMLIHIQDAEVYKKLGIETKTVGQ